MARYDAYSANQGGPPMSGINYQPESQNYRDQYYDGPQSSSGHTNQPWTPSGAYGGTAGAQSAPYDFSRNNAAMNDDYNGTGYNEEMVEPSAMRTSGGGYQTGGFGPISGNGYDGNGEMYDEEEEREPWYRRTKGTVIFLILAAVAAIIALSVGLGVGLSTRNANNDAENAANASSSLASTTARSTSSNLASIRTFTSEIVTTVPVSTSSILPPTTSLAPITTPTTTSTSTTPTTTSSSTTTTSSTSTTTSSSSTTTSTTTTSSSSSTTTTSPTTTPTSRFTTSTTSSTREIPTRSTQSDQPTESAATSSQASQVARESTTDLAGAIGGLLTGIVENPKATMTG